MNLHLPTRFVLLDKAIATLGSVGVELYPAFNVFEVAQPYARELMVERFSPSRLAHARRRSAAASCTRSRTSCRTRCTTCSRRSATARSRSASCTRGWTSSCTSSTSSPTGSSSRSSSPAGCSARPLIGLLATDGPQIFGIHFLSVIGFVLSGVLGAWLLIGVLRSGRI